MASKGLLYLPHRIRNREYVPMANLLGARFALTFLLGILAIMIWPVRNFLFDSKKGMILQSAHQPETSENKISQSQAGERFPKAGRKSESVPLLAYPIGHDA